uniref:alcohol dehydrogenase (NADP(+)) n=1 Tax=Lotharella globosa TaxID=91324 RepID=A0A7S4DPU3_9EUKA
MARVQSDKFEAFAAYEAKGKIKDFSYKPIPLKPTEVELRVESCGVCHSDLHQVHNDWGIAAYPLVPGHEIVGIVEKVGSEVKELKVGMRVGVGPQTGSCESCHQCERGEQQMCAKKVKSYNTKTGDQDQPYTYGGFSKRMRTSAKWAFPIPEGIPPNLAGPLLCAGITTWTPFVYNKVKKGDKVGILGFGGLGHMAVQFAAKMGCETYVITRSPDKKKEAEKFGAKGFIVSTDAKAMAEHHRTFDFLLSTISGGGVKWEDFFALLKPDSTLCTVGLPPEMSFRPNLLVGNRLSLTGCYLASHSEVIKMLDFCAKHKVFPQTEELEMNSENANKALDKIEKNAVRYRMVLVNKAL